MWCAGQSVGLQLLRARHVHHKPSLQFLFLLQPMRKYFLDSDEWICGPVRKWKVEPFGWGVRGMQFEWRRRETPL
jgi:hypothetical protein